MTGQFLEFEFGQPQTFDVDRERRIIRGTLVRWGSIGKHSNGAKWRFERGSLKFSDPKYVRFNNDHDPSQWLGRAFELIETEEGMDIALKVAEGKAGDRALRLAYAKQKTGLSMEVDIDSMDTDPDPDDPTVLLVNMANLTGVGHVKNPAFDDSRIISVTASADSATGEEEPVMPEKPQETAPATQPVTALTPAPAPQAAPETTIPAPAVSAPVGAAFSVDDVVKIMAAARENSTPAAVEAPKPVEVRPVVDPTAQAAKFAQTEVKEPLPYRFTYQPRRGTEAGKHIFHVGQDHDFSSDLFTAIDNDDKRGPEAKRVNALINAVFDVDTTDVAGTIPARQAPELWQPQMDYATPLWDMISAGTTDGRPFILPKFNTSSGLVVPAVEGTEPAPGAFTVTTQTVTPTAVWGKVEITRQAIRQGGNPQISGIIWDQMLREYYEDREAAVATFLNTLTAATDIALTTPTTTADNDEDQTTVGELEAAIASLMFVRGGNRFTAFAVHQNLFKVLARVKDDAGRPLYPMINPQNSNGTATPLFKTIDFAGTTAVPSWALGAATTDTSNSWLFDPAKVRGWASAPERLDWNFGTTIQTLNIPQVSAVTMGIYGDLALANLDIAGVRQVTFDPQGS